MEETQPTEDQPTGCTLAGNDPIVNTSPIDTINGLITTTVPSPIRVLNPIELYSLLRETIAGSLPIQALIAKLSQIIGVAENQEEFVDLLADTLVQLDFETFVAYKSQRDPLLAIIKSIIREDLISAHTILVRFEIDTIAALGLIPDKRQFMVSYNRLRTKLYFKQKKYNLLREENEGFAKIITSLAQISQTNTQQTLTTVTEIIGIYRVDPNRVLDLVLEVLEYNSRHDPGPFIDFLEEFYKNIQRITQLVILKLSFYTSDKDSISNVPQSFYRLIAIMIHRDLIDFDEVYPHLSPSDSKILDYHKSLVEEGRALSKKYAMAVVGEEKQAAKSVLEMLSDEDRHILEVDNHKINICAHLIDIGDWDNALMVAKRLPELYCFSHRRVATSACDLINYLIDPIYRLCALPKPLNLRIRPIPQRKSLKQITSVEELPSRLFPMLIELGPFLSADTLSLTKVIRILRFTLVGSQDGQELTLPENSLYYRVLDVINDSILPSISLSGGNSSLARELWTLIGLLKYQIRYKLYHNWRDETSNPVMLRNRGQILLRAKHHMKRLSKETLRLTGRHLGKLCYSNPVITLHYILVQIQSYDNLITLVVDALRFLPPITLDALIYCIIENLSDPHKNKKSFDGMALAPWLTSISTFSASIIMRYKVDFISFLEYIANQLKAGNSLDLVLLTDLIQRMTGIETIQAITDDRIEALMGGDVLRTEAAYFNQVKNTKKSSARLRDALIESRLAMPLCILIAQLRDSLFYNQQDGTPLKLVGKLYDQCQETLVQYGVFLSMNLSIDDYINFLPPLDKLMREHKLNPDSAFFLARPMIFHKIKLKFLELKESATRDVMVEEGETPELSTHTTGEKFVEAVRSVIDPIVESVQPSIFEKFGTNNLGPKLFVVFWTLSMSDIEVPVNCYEREISRIKNSLSELGKSSEDNPKRRKERDRCTNLIQKLKQEQAEQIEHNKYMRLYLESEKNSLFLAKSKGEQVYTESRQFVQHCPFARSILTAYDAIYSARFLLYFHELQIENYYTIICLDRLLCDLTYMMGACTENEANHFGRFLCNILKTSAHWHSDATIYNEQCEKYPGSIIFMDSSTDRISYDNYRDICYKWHYRLTRAFTVALESTHYIQIRNALIVMISIIEHYPAIKHFGKGILMKIEDVRNAEKDNRQDLYALATAYAGRLDEKKPQLVPEASFHTTEVKRKSDVSSTAKNSTDSKSSSSRPSSRPSSKTRPATDHPITSSTHDTRSPTSHRERHSSSSSRKRARHS